MILGKVCCPTCQVLYYHGKPYGIWIPKHWFRIKSLISIEWHQVHQVVHSSGHSKGAPWWVQEGFWGSSPLSQQVYWQKSTKPEQKVASVGHTRPAKWQKMSSNGGDFKGKVQLKKYSREEYDSTSMAQCQKLCELLKKTGLIKGKKRPESSRAF